MGTPRESRAYQMMRQDSIQNCLDLRYETVAKTTQRSNTVDKNQNKRYDVIVKLKLKRDMSWKFGDYTEEVTISRINVDGTIVLSNGQVIDPLDL